MKNKTITLLLKPTDACNLRCLYCYHSDYGYSNQELLSIDTIKKILSILINEYTEINLVWHGGEPMLAGLDYYRKVDRIINDLIKYRDDVKIIKTMQTNATLINLQWISYFKKNNYLLGVSFDGPTNEMSRQQTEKVLNNIKLLNSNKCDFGGLAVISKNNINMIETYQYFKKNHINSVRFNPILPEGRAVENKDLLVDPEAYSIEAIKCFDYWVCDKDGINITPFDIYIGMCLGVGKRECSNVSCLQKWLAVAPNGDLYPCTHSSWIDYKLGNVCSIENVTEIWNNEKMKDILIKAVSKRNDCMKNCNLYEYCYGGCPAGLIRDGGNDNFECKYFKPLFIHIKKWVDNVLQKNMPLDNLNPFVKSIFIKYISKFSMKG